jgi:ethanolamine utilization protein EutN
MGRGSEEQLHESIISVQSMIIGKVVGTVVSTQKHYKVEGKKLLLVQPLHLDGKPEGRTLLAIDSVDAGEGDRVLVVMEGRSVSLVAGRDKSPLDAAIVGVVDRVDMTS